MTATASSALGEVGKADIGLARLEQRADRDDLLPDLGERADHGLGEAAEQAFLGGGEFAGAARRRGAVAAVKGVDQAADEFGIDT